MDDGAAPPVRGSDPIMERLDDQIAWYDRNSLKSQRRFKRTKLVVILSASFIPLLATITRAEVRWATGALGLLITVLEGVLQLNQYQQNWIAYRSTCESLKHEKYVYLGKAAPYATAEDPHALLAERVESLVSQEHAKWLVARQDGKPKS
jgi:hypothetical protein